MHMKKSCLKLYFKKATGIMIKLRTLQEWGFSCPEYKVNDGGDFDLLQILFHRARTEIISK